MNLDLRKERKRGFKRYVIPAVLILMVVFCFHFNWLNWMEKTLVISDPLEKADIMVVLSGAFVEERIHYAAKLYHEGYAPKMLLAGHMALQEETGLDVMKAYAIKLGVKEEDILREAYSDVTWTNAVESQKMLQGKNIRSLLIVTSPHHTRRAKLLFRKAFPADVSVRVASPALEPAPGLWYRNPIRIRSCIHEYLSFLWLYSSSPKGSQGGWE